MSLALNISMSILTYLGFYLSFVLALGFWGRLILKILKVKKNLGYGDILPIVVCFSLVLFLTRHLAFFTHDMRLLFIIIYDAGILGAIGEFGYFIVKKRNGYADKRDIYKDFIKVHGRIVVGILLSIIFVFYFSIIWPTGTLEPWLTDNIDYYSWIFGAGYWMGYGDPANFGMSTSIYGYDEYGSHIIFAMFSSVRFELAVISAPAYTVFLLTTIGIGVYTLVRKIFGFKSLLAFIPALGVVGGNFYNFLAFSGLYGQLVATVGFVAALTVIFNKSKEDLVKQLFFPVFFIFMTYQAAYVVYVCLLMFALFLADYFRDAEPKKFNIKIIVKTIKSSLKVIGIIIALSAVLVPQITYQMIVRTVIAASQEAYSLKLFDPTLFCGIPRIIDMSALKYYPTSIFAYGVFFSVIIFLFWVCVKLKNKDAAGQELNYKIEASFSFFIVCILVYLVAFFVMDERYQYQIWKFVSFSALPFSFIPFCLLFSAIWYVTRGKRSLFAGFCIFSIIVISIVPLIKVLSPGYIERRESGLRSLTPMIYTILEVHDFDKNVPRVIFDLYDMKRDYAAAAISQHINKEIGFFENLYFIPRLRDYFKFFTKDAVIYSDRTYDGLYNGVAKDLPANFTIYRYSYYDFRRMGAVKYNGMDTFSKIVIHKFPNIVILMPLKYIGKDTTLNIYFEKENFRQKLSCHKFYFTPEADRELTVEGDIKSFSIFVPKEWVINGYFNFNLEFPGIITRMRWELKNKVPPSECHFNIKGVEITEVQSEPELGDNDELSYRNDDVNMEYSSEDEESVDEIPSENIGEKKLAETLDTESSI
jgi:hypothetical protein